jgi:hypothetical protein
MDIYFLRVDYGEENITKNISREAEHRFLCESNM